VLIHINKYDCVNYFLFILDGLLPLQRNERTFTSFLEILTPVLFVIVNYFCKLFFKHHDTHLQCLKINGTLVTFICIFVYYLYISINLSFGLQYCSAFDIDYHYKEYCI